MFSVALDTNFRKGACLAYLGTEGAGAAGAPNTLADGRLHSLIVELNGQGNRYGFDEDALHRRIVADGFREVTYRPFERALTEHDANAHAPGNRLYVRETARAEVEEHLRTAAPIDVKGKRL